MNISDAIKKEDEIINEEYELMKIYNDDIINSKNENHKNLINNFILDCENNISYHKQLKTWLEELKTYKED